MDRIWQWAWDRYSARYSWVLWVIGFVVSLPVYLLLTLPIVAFEKSGRYVEVAAVTVGARDRPGPARRIEGHSYGNA